MIQENQESEYHANPLDVFVGILIGGLAGVVMMLLFAPRSGKDTRKQIQEKGIELRDRTNKIVEDTLEQVGSNVNKLMLDGREKFNELKRRDPELAAENSNNVSEAENAGDKAHQSS